MLQDIEDGQIKLLSYLVRYLFEIYGWDICTVSLHDKFENLSQMKYEKPTGILLCTNINEEGSILFGQIGQRILLISADTCTDCHIH